MKYLRYKLLQRVLEDGTPVFTEKSMTWSPENETIVLDEAHGGDYIIVDDGVEETIVTTQLDRIEAQVTYTAMMTDTLLEV